VAFTEKIECQASYTLIPSECQAIYVAKFEAHKLYGCGATLNTVLHGILHLSL